MPAMQILKANREVIQVQVGKRDVLSLSVARSRELQFLLEQCFRVLKEGRTVEIYGCSGVLRGYVGGPRLPTPEPPWMWIAIVNQEEIAIDIGKSTLKLQPVMARQLWHLLIAALSNIHAGKVVETDGSVTVKNCDDDGTMHFSMHPDLRRICLVRFPDWRRLVYAVDAAP